MKKVLILLVIMFSANLAMAQEAAKNKYEKNGDLIEATLYHDNGEIAQTGFYNEKNQLHGEWISYDNKGSKTAIANYANGKKVGTWKFFQDDIVTEVIYANAKRYKINTYKTIDTRVVSNE